MPVWSHFSPFSCSVLALTCKRKLGRGSVGGKQKTKENTNQNRRDFKGFPRIGDIGDFMRDADTQYFVVTGRSKGRIPPHSAEAVAENPSIVSANTGNISASAVHAPMQLKLM